MSKKGKGINAERELIHAFWKEKNWTAIRVAGSGCSKYPAPDIVAGNLLRKLAIECKSSKTNIIYIPKEEIFKGTRFKWYRTIKENWTNKNKISLPTQ